MHHSDIPCCSPKDEQISVSDSIDRLESTICALDVKCKAIHYQMTEALIKAKFYKKNNDLVRCKAELKTKFDLERKYERFVNLHTNVVKVRNGIDETKTVGEIANNMNIANKVLETALKSVNPEKIDELMDQLSDNTDQIHVISNLLGEDRLAGHIFDEEKALQDLIEDEIILPDVPKKQKMAILE